MRSIQFVTIFALCFLSIALVWADNPKETTISVVAGGFNPSGSIKTGTFGIPDDQELVRKAAQLLGIPYGIDHPYAPNQIVQVEYYGKEPPKYYQSKDMTEIEAAGKGTPRYALICAKFVRHLMATTGATHVNLAGGSYGALITRYIIEKDLEGLASSGAIVRWLPLEGALAGAYPANLTTDKEIREFAIKVLGLEISDPLTMHYPWVTENVNDPRYATKCPYFKNILIGNHISSNDDLNMQALSLAANKPNDGVLLIEDQTLADVHPDCRFHNRLPLVVRTNTTHMSAKKDDTFMLNIVNFMAGSKRVTINMLRGKAIRFQEDEFFFGKGEVVFQGQVFSPLATTKWNIAKEIAVSNRLFHTSPVVKFQAGETKPIAACLYDWMVHPEEKSLKLKLWAEEVDWDEMYQIHENILDPYQDMGSAEMEIAVEQSGTRTYTAITPNWELTIEVEIYDYGFDQ